MLEKMYWVCSDILTLASQLGTARDLPSPDVLQRRIEGLFDQLARKAQDAGIPDKDVADAKYALVAFLDEQILRSPWPGRQQWMARPLQLAIYGENTAGEGFFQRMDQLSRQPERLHVFQVYYLCLTLGFTGIYGVRQDLDTVAAMIERGAALLARQLGTGDNVSPHGEPRDSARGFGRVNAPVMALGIGILVLAVLLFVGLRVYLGGAAGSAVNEINKVHSKAD